MMHFAARSRSAVSSTTTGGLPGPAAITRLPDLLAACRHRRPAGDAQQRDLGMMEDLLGGFDAGLADGGQHVGHAALALDLAIEQLQRVLRHPLPDGCGPKIAVLPAARMLMALEAIVGTE